MKQILDYDKWWIPFIVTLISWWLAWINKHIYEWFIVIGLIFALIGAYMLDRKTDFENNEVTQKK